MHVYGGHRGGGPGGPPKLGRPSTTIWCHLVLSPMGALLDQRSNTPLLGGALCPRLLNVIDCKLFLGNQLLDLVVE